MALSLVKIVGAAPTPEECIFDATVTTYLRVNYFISLMYVLKSLNEQAIHLNIIFYMRVSTADNLQHNREQVV